MAGVLVVVGLLGPSWLKNAPVSSPHLPLALHQDQKAAMDRLQADPRASANSRVVKKATGTGMVKAGVAKNQ